MKHGPAGFTPSSVPYGSIQDALSIRVQDGRSDRRYHHCCYCCSLCQFGNTHEAQPCRLHSIFRAIWLNPRCSFYSGPRDGRSAPRRTYCTSAAIQLQGKFPRRSAPCPSRGTWATWAMSTVSPVETDTCRLYYYYYYYYCYYCTYCTSAAIQLQGKFPHRSAPCSSRGR